MLIYVNMGCVGCEARRAHRKLKQAYIELTPKKAKEENGK